MLTWMVRVLALVLCILSEACTGAVISTTGDDADDGGDADPGVDWTEEVIAVCPDGSAAHTTIASAIAAAPDASTIEVCAGTYAEQLVVADRSVRLRGAGAGVTILDPGGAGIGLAVTGGRAVELDGFTIQNGVADLGGGVRCVDAAVTLRASEVLTSRATTGGGGLYGERCAVEIENARFEGNDGGLAGGAAFLVESTGSIAGAALIGNSAKEGGALYLRGGGVDVTDSDLTGNHARARGGAVYQSSDSTIEDSDLSDNDADWTGGAIYVDQHAPTLSRITVRRNDSAWEGGGIYFHQSHATIVDSEITDNTSFDDGGGLRIFESEMRVERNLIARNHAVDGDGGGLKVSHLPCVFVDNRILNNEALRAGGGVEHDNDSSQVHGGEVSGNKASIGGGVHVMLWPWNDGVIEDVVIANNRAWRGGGVYLENNFRVVTMRGLTISGNHANQGAGVYTRGTPLRLSNSVITANDASDVGGGVFTDPSASYPWTSECPCPPIDPAASISFIVVHGNVADAGAAVWSAAPNVTFESSIFAGHAGSSVQVAQGASTPAWRYNDTYPATFAGMGDPTGANGNLSAEPKLMAPAAGNFQLDPTSVCRDAGDPAFDDPDGTRADMGAHAGPTPMP